MWNDRYGSQHCTVASTCGMNGLVQETVQWQVLVRSLIWIMILYCGGDESRDLLSDSSYALYTAWN
jgi:hypothetical protein